MKPIFKVVGGLDLDQRITRKELRKRAAPLHKQWKGCVDSLVKIGNWSPRHGRLADELLNYPSADEGRCYASQERLGKNIGCGTRGRKGEAPKKGSAARAARRLLADFCDEGLLVSKRGGPARTASWILSIDGKPLFGGATPERTKSAPERTKLSGLERTKMSAKPSERNPFEHEPPPQSPPQAPEQASQPRWQPTENLDAEAVHHGEVLGPEGEITFNEFWRSIRRNPGQPGPAIAAWSKLNREDRRAVGALIGPDGIELGRVWACVWLKARMWEQPPIRSAMDDALDALRRAAEGESPASGRGPSHSTFAREYAQRAADSEATGGRQCEMLQPYCERWTAERKRKLGAGESVALMDRWASEGRGWTIRRTATS